MVPHDAPMPSLKLTYVELLMASVALKYMIGSLEHTSVQTDEDRERIRIGRNLMTKLETIRKKGEEKWEQNPRNTSARR